MAAKIVRSTHERWDGTGYPDRLAGPEIPLGARIISVCDAFDAMTPHRPYAAAADARGRLRELFRCAGKQFDPAVVEAFAAVQADLSTELVADSDRKAPTYTEIWAVSSVGEQGTLNPKVEGSNPSRPIPGAGRNRMVRAFVSDSSLVWTSSDSGLYSAITVPTYPSERT